MADDRLLKIEAASQLLGVPVSTLRYWRVEKKGPPSAKIGGRVVYRESDVKAFVDRCFEAAAG